MAGEPEVGAGRLLVGCSRGSGGQGPLSEASDQPMRPTFPAGVGKKQQREGGRLWGAAPSFSRIPGTRDVVPASTQTAGSLGCLRRPFPVSVPSSKGHRHRLCPDEALVCCSLPRWPGDGRVDRVQWAGVRASHSEGHR